MRSIEILQPQPMHPGAVSQAEPCGARVYVKQQSDCRCRPVWAGFRAVPTLRREYRALTALTKLGIRVPEVVRYVEQAGLARLVLREVPDALPLDQALDSGGKHRCVMLAKLAGTIAALHRTGWVHGALYPEHILYSRKDQHIHLIDFDKAQRNPLQRESDLARLWRRFDRFNQRERDHFEQIYRSQLPRSTRVRGG
ncbi:MAG: lipopolysaccharide kinase InaA family protein [Pseudomonadales bacterium]